MRSYNQWEDVYVICPYYMGCDAHCIRCEGAAGAATITSRFAAQSGKQQHMQLYCRTHDWEQCPVSRAVGEKYEPDSP